MNLQEAINFFNSILDQRNKKSENAIYDKFIVILSAIQKRDLSEVDLQLIEKEIAVLQFNAEVDNPKKYLGKKLSEFEKFLKDKFSLITEGYYTGLGISYGAAFGVSFGMFFGIIFGAAFNKSGGIGLGLSLGISFGIVIGLIIGHSMDTKAKEQNQVLK